MLPGSGMALVEWADPCVPHPSAVGPGQGCAGRDLSAGGEEHTWQRKGWEDTCLQVSEPGFVSISWPLPVLLYTVELLQLLLEGQTCKEINVWNPEFKPNKSSQQDEEQRRNEFAVMCAVTLGTGLQMCPCPCVNKGCVSDLIAGRGSRDWEEWSCSPATRGSPQSSEHPRGASPPPAWLFIMVCISWCESFHWSLVEWKPHWTSVKNLTCVEICHPLFWTYRGADLARDVCLVTHLNSHTVNESPTDCWGGGRDLWRLFLFYILGRHWGDMEINHPMYSIYMGRQRSSGSIF